MNPESPPRLSSSAASAARLLALADRKAGSSPSQQLLWRKAVTRLAASGLPEESWASILHASSYPSDTEFFAELAERERGSGQPEAVTGAWDSLIERVDESAYSLDDWLAALLTISNWMLEHKKRSNADLTRLQGYVTCCCEVVQAGAREQSLRAVVENMLDGYGIE